MTAASNSEGRKRHEEAALTLRDIGRMNGHGDPVPGVCPECGETAATADEVTRQMVAQVAAHQAEVRRLTEERDEFKGAAGHAFTFQSERDQSRNAHERTKQSLRRMTLRAEAAEALVAEKDAEIERLRAKQQVIVDHCITYRNLAIELGAIPDQMQDRHDRDLCINWEHSREGADALGILRPHWRTDCSDSVGDVYVRWVRCRCGWESERSRTLVNIPDMHEVWNGHLAEVLAAYVAEQQAQALRDFADRRDDMACAWGGLVPWLTNGDKVADLVREWAEDAADEIEQEADRG